MKKYISVQEAAKKIGVSDVTVRRKAENGEWNSKIENEGPTGRIEYLVSSNDIEEYKKKKEKTEKCYTIKDIKRILNITSYKAGKIVKEELDYIEFQNKYYIEPNVLYAYLKEHNKTEKIKELDNNNSNNKKPKDTIVVHPLKEYKQLIKKFQEDKKKQESILKELHDTIKLIRDQYKREVRLYKNKNDELAEIINEITIIKLLRDKLNV